MTDLISHQEQIQQQQQQQSQQQQQQQHEADLLQLQQHQHQQHDDTLIHHEQQLDQIQHDNIDHHSHVDLGIHVTDGVVADASLFIDPEGQPFRFFLPMSLASRNTFKEKIEGHGGVIVPSELMPNIIKIGDPAKPNSFDSSWLNFRYIDDAIRAGHLQNAEFYVMDNPPHMLNMLQEEHTAVTQRATPSNGSLPNGVGSRGTRMEFTPEEDDILRRIVHRPGVATSGNKIYQLIASQYGGHSFHSWRDRYIRHMRPIWGPPTEEQVLAVNPTDDFILSQSYLRAPHTSNNRASKSGSAQPRQEQSEIKELPEEVVDQLGPTETPVTVKKQRASFTSTDDEILLTAIAEKGETAATFKYLGARHPHHTWESWKNRVKALKKRNNGVIPKPDDMSRVDTMGEESQADISMQMQPQELPMEAALPLPEDASLPVDPNIDPNLQQLQSLSAILDDPNQAEFEQQFPDSHEYNAQLQEQLRQEDAPPTTFDFPETEQLLRQNLQGHPPVASQIQTRTPARKRGAPAKRGKRQINIHDPTVDENAGAVSDIEDETQTTRQKPAPREVKKRKTNAAAKAAALRALNSPRPELTTPSKSIDPSTQPKSAKQEHHERERLGLVKAVRDDAMAEFVAQEAQEPRRSTRVRGQSQEPQTGRTPAHVEPTSEDDAAAAEQIRQAQNDDRLQSISEHASLAPKSAKRGKVVRATPNSSPQRPPVSQLRAGVTHSPIFEAPSPTPASPPKYHSQYMPDTQDIRGEVDFDFDTTIPEIDIDSQHNDMQIAQEQRKQNWITRQAHDYGISEMDVADAWHKCSGVQSLALKVVEAYAAGSELPQLPGIWSNEDDAVIYSTDARAMEQLYNFHGNAVDTRIVYLNSTAPSNTLPA